MRKTRLLQTMLCLALLGSLLLLTACPGGEPPIEPPPVTPPERGDDTVIYENGNMIEGAGDALTADAAVLSPTTYDESGAQEVPAGNFFRVAANGFAAGKVFAATGDSAARLNGQNGKTYNGKGSVLVLPNGLELSGNTELTLQNMVIVGEVTVKESARTVFENVEIVGKLTLATTADTTVLNACRLTGETAVVSDGDDLTVMNAYIGFTACGIESRGNGLIVQNCRVEGQGTAITSSGEDAAVKYNTLSLDKDDTGISFGKGTVNAIAAMNVVNGAQKSVSVSEARNAVIVRNTLVSVEGLQNRNLYICDNALGGRVTVKNNNYLLVDGNTYPTDEKNHAAVQENNENTNGDTLMNVDTRPEVGADESLLPHVDKDQFVGMERKEKVKDSVAENEQSIYQYIRTQAAAEPYVFIPPGAYSETDTLRLYDAHKDTTIYAYGAYVEIPGDYFYTHLLLSQTENITVKGISCGYALQSCGQVYVLEKLPGQRVRVITGAGMMNEFGNTNHTYFNTNAMGFQRSGDFYALTDTFQRGIIKNSDGTMIMNIDPDVYDIVQPGDLFTCRYAGGEATVNTQYSSNILYKDVTMYGTAQGGCFVERENLTAVTYYRATDTTRSGDVIDEETYTRYLQLETELGIDLEISIDEWGNHRGSPAHIGSIDATHVISCAQGSQVISCLFENMCDDGTNQKSNHARLLDITVEGDVATVTYKPNFCEAYKNMYGEDYHYKSVCPPYRVGDRVYIYTSAGQLVCDSEALTATAEAGTKPSTFNNTTMKLYTVQVKAGDVNLNALKGYDLMDDSWGSTHKVLVDNMSRASGGFLFDNLLVQNVRSRGLLLKSSDGVIKNCTFRNIAKLAVSALYEIYYGESGVTEDIVITRNLIDNVGFGLSENGLYYHYPIGVQGLGNGTAQKDFLLCKNIEISYNKFINIPHKPFVHKGDDDPNNYAVYLRNVKDARIIGNDFGMVVDEDPGYPMLGVRLDGAMNVEMSGNTYSPNAMIDMIVGGAHYINVYGNDVTLGGEKLFPDKE